MAPRKPKPAHLQHQQQPRTSNHHAHHESTTSIPDGGLPTPALLSYATATHDTAPAERTTATLNLRVLQRHSPDVTHILAIAPFAAVYDFGPEGSWEKTGTEGTLFVVQLAPDPTAADLAVASQSGQDLVSPPRFAVLILNRKGLDNFRAPLFGADGVEVADNFVMVTESDGTNIPRIHGLWISTTARGSAGDYDGEAAARQQDASAVVAQVMLECCEMATQGAHEVAAMRRRGVAGERAGYPGWDAPSGLDAAFTPQPPQDLRGGYYPPSHPHAPLQQHNYAPEHGPEHGYYEHSGEPQYESDYDAAGFRAHYHQQPQPQSHQYAQGYDLGQTGSHDPLDSLFARARRDRR